MEDRHITVAVIAVFWQQFTDLIQYVSAAPGQPTYVNLGGADAHGVELTGTARLATHLTLNAHWTWLHTEVTDTGSASSLSFMQGATLIRRPASSGGGTLAYRASGATLAATATRIGDRDDRLDFSSFSRGLPGYFLPGYTTVDAAVDFPLHRGAGRSPAVDLMLRAENLFVHRPHADCVGFPGRGRTLYAGGGIRF